MQHRSNLTLWRGLCRDQNPFLRSRIQLHSQAQDSPQPSCFLLGATYADSGRMKTVITRLWSSTMFHTPHYLIFITSLLLFLTVTVIMRCNTCMLTRAATLVGAVAISPAASNSIGNGDGAAATASVVLSAGTVTGSVDGGVEYFRGIPYAQPPIGPLRLKPPVRLESFGSAPFDATGLGPACPQMTAVDITPLALEAISLPGVEETLFFGTSTGDETEDCLTISVMRPHGTPTPADAKLPVLFWIYGGGFETGSSQQYNGSVLIPQSVAQGTPMIIVAVNYRLGAFGFLGGREVLADGAANLGLLDQRMGLQWVAENIEAFGGDYTLPTPKHAILRRY